MWNPSNIRGALRVLPILLLAVSVLAAGCDDGFGSGRAPLIGNSVTLFSAAREDLFRMPSAIDFFRFQVRPIEHQLATGDGWDVALTEVGSEFGLAAPGVFPGLESMNAGIAVFSGKTLEEVERAPAESSAYADTEPVPLRLGDVYVIRSRRLQGCTVYAKIQAVELDPTVGSVVFEYIVNPNCADRNLVRRDD